MGTESGITQWFGDNLATLLAEKIVQVHGDFAAQAYIQTIATRCPPLGYNERVTLHAETLRAYLPAAYPAAIDILVAILGEENQNETGMFREFYWVMPIGRFIERYGLNDFACSMQAIAEVTKRNTGEYAIRPYLRAYPQQTIRVLQRWSRSKNFHLRRLASEGARPKLPWATKLDTFIDNPQPVFRILANLMADDVKFVQKSVANHITDYLKVNRDAAVAFIEHYRHSDNKHTQWILKHATRKIPL